MTPLISFIIAYHNEPEALLKACVESILSLRLSPEEAEIIVVDDGSESPCTMFDGQGTKDNVALRIYRQEQAGLSVARNTGISHAHGQYIQFVDADDCLVTSVYRAILEQLRKDTADIILFRMTTKPPLRSSLRRVPQTAVQSTPQKEKQRGDSFLIRHNLRAAACAYAFRREILGDLRFYPGLLHEDELFTPQLFLRAKSLCELNIAAYYYRQHSDTITHSVSQTQVQKRMNDIHFIINELKRLNEFVLERRIRQLTVDYLQKTWTLTHSIRELRKRIAELRTEGLFPLPLRCYSMRYLFIASIANLI